MPSSDFTVNGASLPQLISVDWGASVSCAIVSAQGLSGITWSVIGKSRSSLATPTLTPAGSPSGSTMTFSMPAEDGEGSVGASYLIECSATYTVGSRTETSTTTAVIGVAMDSGVVPGCLGETTERGPYGWLSLLNAGASGSFTAPAADGKVPYSSSSAVAWTTSLWMGEGWLGVGATAADLPVGGIRIGLGAGYSIGQKLASGSDAAVFYAYAGGSGTTDALFCDAGFRTIYADVGTSWVFQVDGDQRFAISDGAITFGPAALCPTSGEWRVRNGWNVRGFMASEAGGSALLAYSGATPNALAIGDGYYLDHVTVAASTYLAFYAGSDNEVMRLTPTAIDCKGKGLTNFTIDALDLTGIDVQTSAGSIETLERGVAALDAGADGAPVAVVAYTVPVGYKATLRCWVCGETNSTQVPAFDTQWIIKCYRKTGGNVTQYAAAVTPNDEADPTTASVAVTYGLTGGVVTLYKANTSGTAMRFSGQIVVSLDALVGAGA